jgi:hypothetical protein
MKALTITQPYATLIAIGAKTIETCGWLTKYRGPIAIHAGAGLGPVGGRTGLHSLCASAPFAKALLGAGYSANLMPAWGLPLGAIVAVANLTDIAEIMLDCMWGIDERGRMRAGPHNRIDLPFGSEMSFGDYSPGRYAWLLANVRRLPEPVPCKGALSSSSMAYSLLWQLPPDVLAAVSAQLQEAI